MGLSLDDIRLFPKAELHRHIDGSIPKNVVRRIALRSGLREFRTRSGLVIPVADEAAFDQFYQIIDVPSFDELLSRFDFVLGVMQTPEDIEEIFYEATLDLAEKNIWYVEWTFAPAYHTRGGLSLREVFKSALRGIERGRADTSVLGKLIPCIQREAFDREKPEDKRDPLGLELAKVAVEFGNRGVVALGLVCNEAKYPPEIYKEAFQYTVGKGISRTVHAGEFGADLEANVRNAVLELRANGIGHGTVVGKSPLLQKLLWDRGVRLELNPISNLLTGAIKSIGDLRVDHLMDINLSPCIGSDDPVLFRQDLAENLKAVLDYYGWGEMELKQLTNNSLNSGFMSEEEWGERWELFKAKMPR